MKRINQYKKMFGVEQEIELASLKKTYRSLVKEWHPDKFQEDDPLHAEAQVKSKEIIDGYHFLVGIAPETKAANLDDYMEILGECGIDDYRHKGQLLEVTFTDGACYEYFGVTQKMFAKLQNADNPMRFGKRNIFNSYLYRRSKKSIMEEQV
ncbi:KTSC domain-containing protein [Labilibacter marinus]|uniref:KTSC domain-containing protein n=1 Tax=Labilibacter marinus TaxID=1477105 RepID=UPI0008347794|nr:KTSC domain-containing protein [Labilibacter marinus]